MLASKVIMLDPGDGYRYRVVVGLLDAEETRATGGDTYFSFGWGHSESSGYCFNQSMYPDIGYLTSKLNLYQNGLRMRAVQIAQIALCMVLGVESGLDDTLRQITSPVDDPVAEMQRQSYVREIANRANWGPAFNEQIEQLRIQARSRDVIARADVQTLEQVLGDLVAWYDLTEGWRDDEGDNLSETDPIREKADVVFDALCNLLSEEIKSKKETAL